MDSAGSLVGTHCKNSDWPGYKEDDDFSNPESPRVDLTPLFRASTLTAIWGANLTDPLHNNTDTALVLNDSLSPTTDSVRQPPCLGRLRLKTSIVDDW